MFGGGVMGIRRSWKTLTLIAALITALISLPNVLRADQNYSQQMFFENSLSPGYYFYSGGSGPELKYGGTPIVAGPGWEPSGAEQTATG